MMGIGEEELVIKKLVQMFFKFFFFKFVQHHPSHVVFL